MNGERRRFWLGSHVSEILNVRNVESLHSFSFRRMVSTGISGQIRPLFPFYLFVLFERIVSFFTTIFIFLLRLSSFDPPTSALGICLS